MDAHKLLMFEDHTRRLGRFPSDALHLACEIAASDLAFLRSILLRQSLVLSFMAWSFTHSQYLGDGNLFVETRWFLTRRSVPCGVRITSVLTHLDYVSMI